MEDEFDQWLDEQSQQRIQVAYDRATKRDTEWWDDDSFGEVLHEEVWMMYIRDIANGLVQDGLAQADVKEDGSLEFTLTEEGHKYHDSISS